MSDLEFGALGVATPGLAARAAKSAEEDGYDIFLLSDSQNLRGDPYTQLVLAAKATSTIKIGTGVTNPVTRHAAVTAASIMSVHAESGGRAILGIGRGDSALLHIGRKPAPLKAYRAYVLQLQAYLSGEEVDQNGFPSRLRWIDNLGLPRVPVDMSCSGPKSIAIAASIAERVTFAVGGDPERVAWALDTARRAAKEAGRDPDSIRFGAWVNSTVDPDERAAREALRGTIATFAHFNAGDGMNFDEQPERLRNVTTRLQADYDTRFHTQATAPHARALDDEFLAWFGAAGPADYVTERLARLVKLGLNHLYLPGSTRGESREAFSAQVMPALRNL
jgi:5,10-methylenetetrahydromethanopterin reductase